MDIEYLYNKRFPWGITVISYFLFYLMNCIPRICSNIVHMLDPFPLEESGSRIKTIKAFSFKFHMAPPLGLLYKTIYNLTTSLTY